MPDENDTPEISSADLHSQYRQEMCDWLREPGGKRLDELFKDPLLEQAPTSPTLPPPGNAEEAWQQCAKLIDKHDDDMCKAYREGIDTLLVFAGLFSAVVTAFSVESYQWLQKQPEDPSVALLAHIVQLLSQNQSTNFPVTPVSDTVGPGLSPSTAARINAYWFLSLTLSLSAALVGILCKEWVREFGRDAGQSAKEYIGLRQMKFEGFEAWKIREIISTVPLLLQVALWLFILGLLELLARLHTGIAALVSVAAGLALLFYATTTFIPAVQYGAIIMDRASVDVSRRQSAFKSPQAWLVLCLATKFLKHWPHSRSDREVDSWASFDLLYHWMYEYCPTLGSDPTPSSSFRGLAWLMGTMKQWGHHDLAWNIVWGQFHSFERWISARTDIMHVIRTANDLGRRAAATSEDETLIHLLDYALRTTMNFNDRVILYSQSLGRLPPQEANYFRKIILGSLEVPSVSDAITKESVCGIIRSLRLLIPTTHGASTINFGNILEEIAMEILLRFDDRNLTQKLVRYVCADFLLWVHDQPLTPKLIPIITRMLTHMLSSLSSDRDRLRDEPHLGLYTALVRRTVDLVCSPLPDVDWVAHILSKMESGAYRLQDYGPAFEYLLMLAFPERSEVGELSPSVQAAQDDGPRTPELPPIPTSTAEALRAPSESHSVETPPAMHPVDANSALVQVHDTGLNTDARLEHVEYALTTHTGTIPVENDPFLIRDIANLASTTCRDKRGAGSVRTESQHSIELVLQAFAGWQDDEDILPLALEPGTPDPDY